MGACRSEANGDHSVAARCYLVFVAARSGCGASAMSIRLGRFRDEMRKLYSPTGSGSSPGGPR